MEPYAPPQWNERLKGGEGTQSRGDRLVPQLPFRGDIKSPPFPFGIGELLSRIAPPDRSR